MVEPLCQCPLCGWMHKHLQAGLPPVNITTPPGRRPAVVATGWAVKRKDGDVVADFRDDITEEKIWQIALGWPPPDEIAWHKENGTRAFRCELHEVPK